MRKYSNTHNFRIIDYLVSRYLQTVSRYESRDKYRDASTRRGASEVQRANNTCRRRNPVYLISASSASTVAKLIIKLSDNQKKSRTKQSLYFADHLSSQIPYMSTLQRRVTSTDWLR